MMMESCKRRARGSANRSRRAEVSSMKLRKTLLALAVGAGLSIGVAPAVHAAEIFAKVGTFGAQFLKVGVSARATAMGSAYTAVGDNAEAVYWNPAGIV